MAVQIGERKFSVIWEDIYSVEKFREELPLTLRMRDLHGGMMFAVLKEHLPYQPQPAGIVDAGELALYGSNCLVLFCKRFSLDIKMTRLGRLTEPAGLEQLLGKQLVEVLITEDGDKRI